MTRSKLITVAALAVVAIACSESVGGMLEDAGQVMRDAGDMLTDAGDMMQPDAGAQGGPLVECNMQFENPFSETKEVWHWAEFYVASPGQTEVTVCTRQSIGYGGRVVCSRSKAAWYSNTNTGQVLCGVEYEDRWDDRPTSIIVHN